MKKSTLKFFTFMLVFSILLPIISFSNSSIASAKWRWDWNTEPSLSATDKTLDGSCKTFELTLINLSTYVKSIKWYTLNDKVATVKAAKNGRTATVTSVSKGTTNIRCKITYKDNVVNLYCKITVKSTTSDIAITNARNDIDGRQVMEVGDKYDFDSKISPGNTSEKTYWFINNDYYASVDSKGMVTAKKIGVVALTAVAAMSDVDAASSNVRDQILIEIVDYNYDNDDDDYADNYQPQAKLLSLVRTDKNRLTASFDRAIQTPGLILVNNNTECIEGKVDSGDSSKVNYSLSAVSSQLTGWKEVSIGYWEGYRVAPDNNTADKLNKMNVDFTVNGLNPLPVPVLITQSQIDNNIITIQFNNKLDEATAKNKANYSIAGATITSVELVNTTGSAAVKLSLKPGSILYDSNYLATISGIKGYNNTYTVMNPYYVSVSLKENTAPVVTGFYYSYPTTITFTFNEIINGNADFRVIQNNTDYVSYSMINNNTVTIILRDTPELNKTLQVIPTQYNSITDLSGNKTGSTLTRNLTPNYN